MVKIAITELEYEKSKAIFKNAITMGFVCLKAPCKEKELAKFIKENSVNHVIVGIEPYNSDLYFALEPGSVIARFGVGFDSIDLKLASKRGLLCTNTPDVLTNCVAEHAIALMLCAAKGLNLSDNNLKTGTWQSAMGFELSGKKLAIIGTGKTGRKLAQIASLGFNMDVIGLYNKSKEIDSTLLQEGFSRLTKNFEEAVLDADFVSIHLPLLSKTKHFFNSKTLSLLPKKSWLINTARGGVIDEKVLYKMLLDKKIAGACLDVFENEPYSPIAKDCDIRKLNNVILSPHLASTTKEACSRMASLCLKNIESAETDCFLEMNLLHALDTK